MAKVPVARKASMYAVKGSADFMTHSGLNTKPKTVESPPWSEVEPAERAPAALEAKCFLGDSLDTVQEEPYCGASEAPKPKTKPEWPFRLKALEVSVAEFGRLTGTPLRTIKGWATGENETHGWVEPMICLMERDPANIAALKAARKK